MSYLMDIWHSILAVFTSADLITLVIMAAIAVAAGFILQEMGSLLTITAIALLVYCAALYGRAVMMGGKNADKLADTGWHNFMALPLQTVLAYAIPFAVLIAIVHAVRQAVWR